MMGAGEGAGEGAVLVWPGRLLGLHGDLNHAQPGMGNTSVHNVSL